MEEKKDIRLTSVSNTDGNNPFDQRYVVIIVKDISAKDGYDFFHPDQLESQKNTDECCVLTYYYKPTKKHNPILIVESISGDNFENRKKIINDFLKHFALTYSVQCNGFYE